MRSLLPLLFLWLVVSVRTTGQSSCASQEYLEQSLRNYPSLAAKLQKIQHPGNPFNNKEFISGAPGISSDALPLIRIPVVVHVVYNRDEQNISDEQVLSQIETLNREFRKSHADTAFIPQYFKTLAADCHIEFALAKVDPRGYATSGIVRKNSSVKMFGMDDRIKSSAGGGSDAWDSDRYLNIWVGNMVGGIIGYSSPLGGPKEKDGIVVAYFAFGIRGTIRSPYTKGRTALHEVGHWLGLKHIWGERSCGTDDVEDTPPQSGPTRGCPSGVVRSCSNDAKGNMYNNYMDLTNDDCMNMFTYGQRDRMRESFLPGNPRYLLTQSTAITATPLAGIPLSKDSTAAVKFHLYPNPAQDRVRIVYSGDLLPEGNRITVHNSFGQLVQAKSFTVKTIELDIQSLHEGVYYIRVNGQPSSVKLIKSSRLY